jgi:DNA-binding MarR family transcriptional regulator
VKFPEHAALNAYTGFLLRKVSAASFAGFSEIAASYGLHPMHFGMLTMIEAEEPISQRELARRTGIDPSTMVSRMDALYEKGLVERDRSPEDRRSYEIRLSPAGRKLLVDLRKRASAFAEQFFAPLTAKERAQFHELLAKLAVSLDQPDEPQGHPPATGR